MQARALGVLSGSLPEFRGTVRRSVRCAGYRPHAGLANYIDAGSIVAGAAGLTLWTTMFHLSSSYVGLIGAVSSNAISAGVGALIGGRLCDKLGRKKIYQWDMLFYAFGLLFIIFAASSWMLLVGYVIAGLAVGADVPAPWTLIAELAPDGARGKHSGVAQVLWYCGPVVVLLLSLAMSPLGVLGIRIVFAHLFVLAICLWFARRSMKESEIWTTVERAVRERAARAGGADPESQDVVVTSFGHARELFNRRNVGAMAFLIGMYGIWNLWAGCPRLRAPGRNRWRLRAAVLLPAVERRVRTRNRAGGRIGRVQPAGAPPASRWPAQLGLGLLPVGPRAHRHPLAAVRRPVHLQRRAAAERGGQRQDSQR